MNHNLDKAREWAEIIFTGPANARARATAEIIRSLPDQWVDVEKVRGLADQLVEEAGDFVSEGLADEYMTIAKRLRDILPAPKLPTLADMSEEEREACQWMQAKIPDSDQIHVIANVWPTGSFLWRADGHSFHRNNALISPLPDLPKLQWPGSGDEPTIAQKEKVAPEQAVTKDVCNNESNSSETPKSSIKPEDVPAKEPWLIEVDGQKAIGTRYAGSTVVPWAVAALDGSFLVGNSDNEITLIHKLVPEPPALPEGMRLADHETYGRVVVSPKVDKDGEYMIFFPRYNYGENGSDYEYAHKSELTFLDGDQHV